MGVVAGGIVTLCDNTRLTSFSKTTLNTLEPPGKSAAERFSCAPLFWKFQVKLAGAGGTQPTVPSLIVPWPLAKKIIVLSLKQAGICADTSTPPALALLNFQLPFMI